jgi:hypothetical protein
MLRPEDIEKILTTQDLSAYLKDMLKREDRDLHITIDYESGELFLSAKGFSYGLSILIDPFGVWVIREVVSQDAGGTFTQGRNSYKTENTMTVIRAVARWIRDIEESVGESKKK